MRLRAYLLIVILLLIISACTGSGASSVKNGTTAPTTISNAGQPTVQLNLDDAQRVAAEYLTAWAADQYDVMYGLLTVNSRDAFPIDDFKSRYQDAEHTMTVLPNGKVYTLTNAIQEGSTADIAYDITFKTQALGDVVLPGRTLHLATTTAGWGVAWSPDDIFAGMSDGATLNLTQSQPTRASIYDRDGQVIADEQGEARLITLLTKSYPTGKPEDCFAELGRVFKRRTPQQLKDLYGGRTGQDYAFDIGTLGIDTFLVERPNLERVCTLDYQIEHVRRYEAGGLAPHVVGYVGPIPAEQADQWTAKGYSIDTLVGLDGVEKYWESTLAGRGAAALSLRVRGGDSQVLATRAAQPSQNVYLTINRQLQTQIQDMFTDAYSKAQWAATSTGAAAVVMDVHTGEILAIASYPDFNVDAFNPNTTLPNAPQLITNWLKDPRQPTFNRATQGQYPAGSVFKIVSMAAAADSGIFSLNTLYTCTGTWNGKPIGDITRRDWIYYSPVGQHGTINLKQALTGSCDTYFWNVGWTLNNKNPQILIDYAKQMGFGAPTGIKDVAEASGNIPDPKTAKQDGSKWRNSDALNFVIGQGDVLVTPLQITRMIAAIANGGTLYQPYLVKAAGMFGDMSFTAKPIVSTQLTIKPSVIKGIQEAMCNVTTDPTLGTATFVFKDFKGAVVCGKTGTAQTGGIYDQPDAWFAAYAGKTADNPDIAIAVVVEHSNEGSFVAAPIVRRIVEQYYNLDVAAWPDWWFGGNGGTILHSGD